MRKYARPEITAMQGYVSGEQPQGNEAVKLNTNENPYRASDRVYKAIGQTAECGLARYPDPLGQVVRLEAAKLFGVDPESILCGNGSDDLLTILVRTFVGSGELIRVAYPSYILYESLAEIQGAFCEKVPFNADWTLPKRFEENPLGVSSNRENNLRLVFLANPNSPSGTIISMAKILEIAERLPCPLVVDEAYADFANQHCIDLVAKCEKIIVCRTLSKSYALAGLRFGFLVAAPKLVVQMLKVKDSYNCDALSIAAAAAALSDQEWLAENRQKILATRSRLQKRMRKLGFDVPHSHGNFTWNTRNDRPVQPIYAFLKEHGFLVRYMNYPGWGDGLRISVGSDEQTDRCVDLIEEFLVRL